MAHSHGLSKPSIVSMWILFLMFSISAVARSQDRVIYPFPASPDCSGPIAPLISDENGNLYGTASNGGSGNHGCVFKLSRQSDGRWSETTLYSFSGSDGAFPYAALVFDNSGNLYGTTVRGGTYDGGIAFELSPAPDGEWVETVLHSFGGQGDGFAPRSKLVFDANGNLYSTTEFGGSRRGGTAFKLSPAAVGWTEAVLYDFPGKIAGPNGAFPAGGVVVSQDGSVYGATLGGGVNGYGAIYRLHLSNGSYKERVIHSFGLVDGLEPDSDLVEDAKGNLYGTTFAGGTNFAACPYVGCGTYLS